MQTGIKMIGISKDPIPNLVFQCFEAASDAFMLFINISTLCALQSAIIYARFTDMIAVE